MGPENILPSFPEAGHSSGRAWRWSVASNSSRSGTNESSFTSLLFEGQFDLRLPGASISGNWRTFPSKDFRVSLRTDSAHTGCLRRLSKSQDFLLLKIKIIAYSRLWMLPGLALLPCHKPLINTHRWSPQALERQDPEGGGSHMRDDLRPQILAGLCYT